MGGIAALVAGAGATPPLAGVVKVSAPARFRGMDGIAAAKRLRVPVLYVAADRDVSAGYDFAADARAMHAATASRKRLELLPGSLHGISLVGGSPAARAAVERFLAAR